VINAFLYLQFTTVKNALVQRIKRLKQPKYLFGAIAGGIYFYFVFFRRVLGVSSPGSGAAAVAPPFTMPPDLAPYLVLFAALVLLLLVVVAWVVPSDRAALHFSEAEVAFIFPAPVTRRWLIHFKLLRSQFGILVSVFFLSLIFRRASFLGGSPFLHAAGWWVILSTLNLHLIAASFVREQLLDLGVNVARRRALVLGVLVVLGASSWWWLRGHVAPPAPEDLTGPGAMIHYAGRVLTHPPIGWILAPFALVVRPYFATDYAAFFLALGPALLLMAAHYWWVMRAEVAFEEASIDQARKTAEVVAAVRAGDWRAGRNRPAKPRPAAFQLAPTGLIAVAFLWKNLIALGPFFRMRTWLIFAGLIVGFHVWAITTGLDKHLYAAVAIVPLSIGGWLLIAGPMIMRRDVRLMVTHFDLLRSYPLPGWQVVLGSLLPPIVILAAVEWLLLLLGAPSIGSAAKSAALAAGVLGTGALGIALVLPPLAGLMLSIPFAATLYFPAWAESSGSRGGGIEVMGQRLIFFAGYIVVLLVALVPAALCGGLVAFIVNWLAGTVTAIVATAVVACLVLGAEFAGVVWWLGERFEHFDMSQEMPR
jgi:hypothetical protein